MDIEISLKSKKSSQSSVKPKYVQEVYILGNLAFFQIYMRICNSSLWKSQILSLFPAHILRSADIFRSFKSGTLRSILQSFLSWIRNLDALHDFGPLGSKCALRTLVALSVFAQVLSVSFTVIYSFPVRSQKGSDVSLYFQILCESQIFVIDCHSMEFIGNVSVEDDNECKIRITLASDGQILMSASQNLPSKQIKQLLIDLCRQYNVPFANQNLRETKKSVDEIPQKASLIKNHPTYILESHLKKYETLHPQEIAGFLDSETVYFRKHAQKLRSKEAWLTQFGMSIKVMIHRLFDI